MKFNLTEIGGRETGAAAIRPVGTTTLEDALAYANAGRRILGDFKQRLQQGGLKDGRFEQALKDGTVITVVTNMIGLAPIDQIYVDTGNRKLNKKSKLCFGYIVQCIADSTRATKPVRADYKIRLDLPSGDILYGKLPFSTNFVLNPDPVSLTDFPDNNAKYLIYYRFNPEGGGFSLDSGFQLVSAAIHYQGLTYEKLGPVVYTKGSATGIGYPETNTLNPGWSYVTTASSDSGACGIDADTGLPVGWSFTSTPCTSPIIAIAYDHLGGTQVFDSTTHTGTTLMYAGTYHQVELPLFPDTCVKDYTKASPSDVGDGTPNTAVNDWDSRTGAAVVAVRNEASEYAYNYSVGFYNDELVYEYIRNYSPYVGGLDDPHVGPIMRRADARGFITYSGFYFDNGIIQLPKKSSGYGQTALFMIPLDDTQRFRYTDDIQTAINSTAYEDTIDYNIGYSQNGDSGTDCEFSAFGTVEPDGVPPSNIYETTTLSNQCTDLFGVPCTVEYGQHTVGIAGNHGDITVWLMIEDETGKFGSMKLSSQYNSLNDLWHTHNNDTPSMNIHIKVGYFEDIAELVSFEQL
jgi:hypothetical protein